MNEKSNSFLEDIKWLSIIIAFVASVICNYFLLMGDVRSNSYRLNIIEQDRAERWEKYDRECTDRDILLKMMSEDIAIIKVKLEMIEEKL